MPTSAPGISRQAPRRPLPSSSPRTPGRSVSARKTATTTRYPWHAEVTRKRTSEAARRPRVAGPNGFTLIEILVVVAILAIAAGIAAVTLSGDERGTLAREARRFAGAVEYAADRARVRHETIGVSASGEAWRFWRRTVDGRWSALSDDPALAPRTLPPPLRAVPHSYAGGALRPDAIVPLRASGRNEPFAFILASEHLQTVVSTDPLSRVSVSAAESIPR
jgi:general secretion pathway protein H